MKTLGPQDLSSRPVAECKSAAVAEALTRSFEGYVVPLQWEMVLTLDERGTECETAPGC
jgi:hypothetical protein